MFHIDIKKIIFKILPVTLILVLLLILTVLVFEDTDKSVLPMLVYTFVFLLFTSILLYVLFTSQIIDLIKNFKAQTLWALAVMVLFSNLFVYFFSSSEKTINFWDHAGYWKGTLYYSQDLINKVPEGLSYVYSTIENEDYSAVPCFFLAPLLKFLGMSFTHYVVSIYNFFLITFYIVAVFFFLKVKNDVSKEINRFNEISTFSIFLFPPLIIPCLVGYLDAIGLFFIILLVVFVYKSNLLSDLKKIDIIIIVFLLVILSITRRWYAFWIVSLFFSAGFVGGIRLLIDEEYKKDRFIKLIINLTIIGLSFLFVLFTCFNNFLKRSLFNNYGDIYSAYKFGGFKENLYFIIQHNSYLIIGLFLLGVFYSVKRTSSRYFSLFLFIQLSVIIFLFLRIQGFGWQHYYLIGFGTFFFVLEGINFLSALKYGKFLSIFVVGMLFINFVHTFFNPQISAISSISPVLSQTVCKPRIRSDFKELGAAIDYVNSIEGKKNVYVLASSFLLNDDIIRNFNLPEKEASILGLAGDHSNVDKRDKFPNSFLSSDIVMVASPIQYHLRPEDQRVVGVFAEQVLSGEKIGKFYKPLKEFNLVNGIKLKIYEKTSPFNIETLDSVKNLFQSYYPEYPHMYDVNSIPAIMVNKITSGGYSAVDFYDNYKSCYIHPGDTSASSFSLFAQKKFNQISFNASFKNANSIKDNCGENGGEVKILIYKDGIVAEERLTTFRSIENFKIDIKDVSILKVEVNNGNYGPACDGLVLNEIEIKR